MTRYGASMRVGSLVFWGGCIASAAVIALGLYRGGDLVAHYAEALLLFSFPVALPAALSGLGLVYSYPVLGLTHGALPFMRRHWGWFVGVPLWCASVVAVAVGV